MAKSKNHTNKNQNYKAHRNGIKKPKRSEMLPTCGMTIQAREQLAKEQSELFPAAPKRILTYEEKREQERNDPALARRRMIQRAGIAKMARNGIYLN